VTYICIALRRVIRLRLQNELGQTGSRAGKENSNDDKSREPNKANIGLPDAGLENNRLPTRRKRTIVCYRRGVDFAKRSRIKGFERIHCAMKMITKRSRGFVDIGVIDHPCVALRFKERIMEQRSRTNK